MRNREVYFCYWPLKGSTRVVGYPDAAFHNNRPDYSTQRGRTIFIAEARKPNSQDGRGSIVDYESTKIKRHVHSTTVAELYSLMKCVGNCLFLRGLRKG
eukprot:2025080-Karenia_brevis.AAC.1